MFTYLNQWIMNLSFYMVMVTAVMHIVPNSEYKRYIRFFTGLVLAVMLADPFLRLLGTGDLWADLYESPVYQEQLEKMEEAAQFLDGIADNDLVQIKEADPVNGTGLERGTDNQKDTQAGREEQGNPEGEEDEGSRIRVEKIEIGR